MRMHQTRKNVAAAALAIVLIAPGAVWAQRQTPGPAAGRAQPWGNYIGASLGEPEFGELGVKVYGGQQFHPHFAWEASYVNFLEERVPAPLGDDTTELWGVSGAVVGILPLQHGFSLFGKLGLMYGREKVRVSGQTRTDGEFNPLLGVGGHYQFTPQIGVRVEYETFDQGNLLSAGISYRF